MSMDEALLIAEVLSKNEPTLALYTPSKFILLRKKWAELILDFDELFSTTVENYSGEVFIKKCYNYV